MDWQEEHNRRVAQFPDAIRNAHKHSSNHRGKSWRAPYAVAFTVVRCSHRRILRSGLMRAPRLSARDAELTA
jgi:hypothetical protein